MAWQKTRKLVVAAVALSTSAGCLGPLSYRPPKLKAVATVVNQNEKLNLPPAPDAKANNATLAGIDTAHAGVRDDIHILIFTNYSSPAKRTALMDIGRALQKIVVSPPKTADDAKRLQQPLTASLLKLQGIPGIRKTECEEMQTNLYLSTVNTPARSKSFLQHSLLVPGESWAIPASPALAQAAPGAATAIPAGSVKTATVPAPAATPAAPAIPPPVPGKTPGYGTSSVYVDSLDGTGPVSVTPAAATPAVATPAPATPAVAMTLVPAITPSTAPTPAPSASKALPASATPVDDNFLEP